MNKGPSVFLMYKLLMLFVDHRLMNLMNYILVYLMNDWLVNFSNLFLVNYRLMMLMYNLLMMFMDHVLMMLMQYILVVLYHNILMVLLNNRCCNMSFYSRCLGVFYDCGSFLMRFELSFFICFNDLSFFEGLLNNCRFI